MIYREIYHNLAINHNDMTNAKHSISTLYCINFILPINKNWIGNYQCSRKGYQSLEVKPNFNLSGFTPTMGLFCLESDTP